MLSRSWRGGAALVREAQQGAQGLSPKLATPALTRRGPTAVAAPVSHPDLGEDAQRRSEAEIRARARVLTESAQTQQ